MTSFWIILPILLAVPAQTYFLILYSVRSLGAGVWWKDSVGRALFLKSCAITFAGLAILHEAIYDVDHGSVVSFSGDLSIPDLVITTGYWAVCVAVYYQMIVLIRLRREENFERKKSSQGL